MIHSLRTRLILSFGLVIALSLVLVAIASAVAAPRSRGPPVREERIGHLVQPISTHTTRWRWWDGREPASNGNSPPMPSFLRACPCAPGRRRSRVTLRQPAADSLVGELLTVRRAQTAGWRRTNRTGRRSSRVESAPAAAISSCSHHMTRGGSGVAPAPRDRTAGSSSPYRPVTSPKHGRPLLPRLLRRGHRRAVRRPSSAQCWRSASPGRSSKMTARRRRWRAGTTNRASEVRGNDEVANLSRAFNQMSAQVQPQQAADAAAAGGRLARMRTPLTSIQGFTQAFATASSTTPTRHGNLAEVVHAGRTACASSSTTCSTCRGSSPGSCRSSVSAWTWTHSSQPRSGGLRFEAEAREVTVRTRPRRSNPSLGTSAGSSRSAPT